MREAEKYYINLVNPSLNINRDISLSGRRGNRLPPRLRVKQTDITFERMHSNVVTRNTKWLDALLKNDPAKQMKMVDDLSLRRLVQVTRFIQDKAVQKHAAERIKHEVRSAPTIWIPFRHPCIDRDIVSRIIDEKKLKYKLKFGNGFSYRFSYGPTFSQMACNYTSYCLSYNDPKDVVCNCIAEGSAFSCLNRWDGLHPGHARHDLGDVGRGPVHGTRIQEPPHVHGRDGCVLVRGCCGDPVPSRPSSGSGNRPRGYDPAPIVAVPRTLWICNGSSSHFWFFYDGGTCHLRGLARRESQVGERCVAGLAITDKPDKHKNSTVEDAGPHGPASP